MRRTKKKTLTEGEKILDRVKRVGMIILGVSENRNWIELLYEGDLAHAKRIELPGASQILVEEIPHKTTVYEHPRTMIYLDGPCDIEICREGNQIVVRGQKVEPAA
ncbi:MAG: hypothetical protein A3F90_17540 [Deltaproteobacteria bacterium RIFCSPLOWO2_12_FULL_60_19]|nr:MAG: hypothetical protein A3F90_17540 [Deltaproteobacteria bacterium RIFCSPLOWO2_12_FULL_60_19]